jgi:16S rRNA (guanine527-N7)-methyltransferase
VAPPEALPLDLEPADPAVLDAVFGERVGLARRFAVHLATSGVERGLIGPREVPRLWTRHVLNCAVLGELVPEGASVVDVGSGAGLPGVALAVARPDLDVTLVEPLERRTVWLEEVVADLGLPVRVVRARAEEVVGSVTGQVVTARAVAALDRLARWTLPLVAPGGQVLAIKGRSAAEELAAASPALRRAGVVEHEVLTCGGAVLEVPTTVVRLVPGTRAGRPGRRR